MTRGRQTVRRHVDLFYENRDVALIILDVMMPKMDGWQTCREIRSESQSTDHHADSQRG